VSTVYEARGLQNQQGSLRGARRRLTVMSPRPKGSPDTSSRRPHRYHSQKELSWSRHVTSSAKTSRTCKEVSLPRQISDLMVVAESVRRASWQDSRCA
jgi:Holliday junction resolvase RusA-like endonuclease